MVGSIGVVARLDNTDRAERNEGNDPIIIRSSELKAIGAGGPVTPSQTQELQRMVMGLFAMFKANVSAGRPGLDMDAISTGQTWFGKSHNSEPSAIDMGLVDNLSTLAKLIAACGQTN